MADEKFAALVNKAKEIDSSLREARKEMEDLKSSLAAYKQTPKKKKGFWDSLVGDDSENEPEEKEED